ncbi:hypothetical protein YTXLTZUM_CDS0175 [Enterococcus phage VRE9_3]
MIDQGFGNLAPQCYFIFFLLGCYFILYISQTSLLK